MGQLFDKLTNQNSALLNPAGQATFVGAPQQVLARANQALPSATLPNLQGRQLNYDSSQLPTIGKPSYAEAANSGPGGTPNALSPGLTKLGKLGVLLTSGVQGALAGRAAQEQMIAQTGGRRAGGVGTGFQAGYQLPFLRAAMPLELEQKQAETGLARAGLQPVDTPYGQMPASLAAKNLLPWMVRGQAQLGAAEIGAKGKTDAANIAARNRLDVTALQTAITAHKGGKYVADVDPQTGQPFYHVFNPFGQELGRADVNVIPSLMQRTSSTIDWKQDENGDWQALPKTTVSGPKVPGAANTSGSAAAGNGATPRKFHGKVPDMVTGTTPDGRPVAGTPSELRAAGVNDFTKMPPTNASQVVTARNLTGKGGLFDMVADDLKAFKPEELNGLSNRWQEFLTGTFGSDDRYIRLRTHLNGLTGTALMQAHVGSRGGEHMMDHFADLADAHKFTYDNLKAAVDAERQYVEERAMRPSSRPSQGNRPPLSSFEH